MIKQMITVTVKNSSKILYDGKALSVSSCNDKGNFDILPFHANFISLIKNRIIVKKKNGAVRKFPIVDMGVLNVEGNEVNIFLGVGLIK